MEQVHGAHKASKFEPQDFISGMPDKVITNILDRLPIQDAVKTDVLSKYWRFKWTLLTRLIFDADFFRHVPDGKIRNRLLLHLKGPITKFSMFKSSGQNDETFDDEYFKHWIMFLSRNGIKDITLKCWNGSLNLPTELYSCTELKHLDLSNVIIPPLCGFHGFPNLLSLHLKDAHFSESTFGIIIVRCPLLEILSYFGEDNTCEPGLIEISKLGNLKKLTWSVCSHDQPMNMIRRSSFHQLSALSKLQELKLEFGYGKFMAEACVDKKVRATFLCLKTLTLSKVNFGCDIMTSFVLEMICNSPNLQNLNITGADCYDYPFPAVCCLDLCCVKQLQLRSVSFSLFRGSENEVGLIKFILASSPTLKKIVISVDEDFLYWDAGIAWRSAGKLLNLQRDFPVVDIDLC